MAISLGKLKNRVNEAFAGPSVYSIDGRPRIRFPFLLFPDGEPLDIEVHLGNDGNLVLTGTRNGRTAVQTADDTPYSFLVAINQIYRSLL